MDVYASIYTCVQEARRGVQAPPWFCCLLVVVFCPRSPSPWLLSFGLGMQAEVPGATGHHCRRSLRYGLWQSFGMAGLRRSGWRFCLLRRLRCRLVACTWVSDGASWPPWLIWQCSARRDAWGCCCSAKRCTQRMDPRQSRGPMHRAQRRGALQSTFRRCGIMSRSTGGHLVIRRSWSERLSTSCGTRFSARYGTAASARRNGGS